MARTPQIQLMTLTPMLRSEEVHARGLGGDEALGVYKRPHSSFAWDGRRSWPWGPSDQQWGP